jgi:hypothetical protein
VIGISLVVVVIINNIKKYIIGPKPVFVDILQHFEINNEI